MSGEAETEGTGRMSDWQPIETAPKDGTEVLVYEPLLGGEINFASWRVSDAYTSGGTWQTRQWLYTARPTHWMPIPNTPEMK